MSMSGNMPEDSDISMNSSVPGMLPKNSSLSVLEALKSRFDDVFDIDSVFAYDFAEFFNFCRYLGYYGYSPKGFRGRLQSPAEFVEHHLGNCWDQTELQREWFALHHQKTQTFLLYYYVSDDFCPSHSILTYQKDGKWHWFEPMCYGKGEDYVGIHEYVNKNALLSDFRAVFGRFGQQNGVIPEEIIDDKWSLYQYDRPKYGISDEEFYRHCRTGRKIW